MAKHSGRQAAKALGDVPRQLAELDGMTVGQLRERHLEVVGYPSRSRNRVQLIKRLAWELQAKAEGGLTERSLAKILELGDAVPRKWARAEAPAPTETVASLPAAPNRDPRLPPPGTVLTRLHAGRKHEVTVGEAAFEYGGQQYRSLSAVARAITGTNWNGWAFFGLDQKARAA